MSKTFDQGKEEVVKLCQHFTTNRQAFFAPGIKEAHIRQMLIDPFFEALGWDVRSAAMVAPQYREVIPEDSLDVEGQQKAPDYTFRVGTLPKFYAEAKKCGVNIGTDPGPAYQLRRYGWSAKLVLSILTDFEELAVYDCTIRPKQSDKASHARVLYFGYNEYPDRWQELWDLFSREAVWSGAFDQYAASKRKRGTSEVDAEFLKEIEGWRDALARNIALRNKSISSGDLNAAVQSTIDRVVFLRMAEDRRLEPYEQLLKLCGQDDIYSRFMRDLCRKADDKYNSGLFHFHKEQETDEDPDRITPKLAVDDKVFRPILQGLYFAHGSPYQFDLLPVEILGTVYERFLGKVIRLTAGHQAKVEEKPEVRKAGGVYYTPKYIVDYIVEHTVGRQIKGRSPSQLAGGKTFPKRHTVAIATEFEEELRDIDISAWFGNGNNEFLTYADAATTRLIQKLQEVGGRLGEMADVQRGVTPFQLTPRSTHKSSRLAFIGTVRRYSFERGEKAFIRFDDTLAEPKPERYFIGPRLLLRELISRQFRLQATKVKTDLVTNKSMQSILRRADGPDLGFLLGILNSRLVSWYFLRCSSIAQRDDFPKIVLKETRSLPIPIIDVSKAKAKAAHDRMVKLVDAMLALHKDVPAAKSEAQKTVIQRQIDATDAEIDRLVYDLYGLTAEEIAIVEETTK